MKYIIILILLLSGILFFINKDDILSKYSSVNKAEVSSSESSDYEEPLRNIGKIKVLVEKSTSTKSVTSPNTINTTVKTSYGNQYRSIWTHFIDNKAYTNLNQIYFWGENVTYYFTDWDSMNKLGFFLGWVNESTNSIFRGSDKWSRYTFTIWRNTEVVTKYQNCAKPFPEHVFFKNVNTLEKKLVQFANNKGDAKLKINAKGEVGALAVVYGDGAVCARFTEGCVGEVSCDIDDDKDFLKSYKEKSIKNILTFHTHDYNSGSKYWSAYNKDGTRINTILSIPPSFSDLKMNWYFKEVLSDNNIFPKLSLIEKVISPTGEGYIYDVTKKSIIAKAKDAKLDTIEENMVNGYSEAQDKSMFKNKRKYPILKDIQVGIDHMIKSIKKLDVNIRPFTVN